MKLSEGAEELLWLALKMGIDAEYVMVDLTRSDPETRLEKRGVPARVEARRAKRVAFTRMQKEIRLDNDYCSTGLWDDKGNNLDYDDLDLPLPLIRRIDLWQQDFDTEMPSNKGGDKWWERHNQEAFEIARELQAALGSGIAVTLYRWNSWLTVDQIANKMEGNNQVLLCQPEQSNKTESKARQEEKMMVDIAALMKGLPISKLEPDWVALIDWNTDGSREETFFEEFWLLEPPAGQRVPYIEPVDALKRLLCRQYSKREEAEARAREMTSRMRNEVADEHWVTFLDDLTPDSPECLPLPDFLAWLRTECHRVSALATEMPQVAQGSDKLDNKGLQVSSDLLDFFALAGEVTASTPMFQETLKRSENETWWSLESLPELPPPFAMIEFLPGPLWEDIDDQDECYDPNDVKNRGKTFLRWREAIRPVALELEKALGEPVYSFADLSDFFGDDYVHRFLVLHWCCTHKPESTFVRYLLKISKAKDVEELKAALIDPASYTHPFKMKFSGLGGFSCRFKYVPPDRQRTVVMLFTTARAREVAQVLLAQRIGTRAIIIAPEKLATNEWIRQATRYCRDSAVHYLSRNTLNDPLKFLALADELCVIDNKPCNDSVEKLSKGAEDLLWLALKLGIDANYYYADRVRSGDPEFFLERRGVPARVEARSARRIAFTHKLKEIRLANDFGSSGLWDKDGKMLRYDQLDLPFPLIRRIALWQQDYDDTETPPNEGSDEWWENHIHETIELSMQLKTALNSETVIKIRESEKLKNFLNKVNNPGGTESNIHDNNLTDDQIGIRLKMGKFGWADLYLSLGATMVSIRLSEVFDPFFELVEWGQKIDEDDQPFQIEIDEEGRIVVLAVMRTENPERVLLRVTPIYSNEVLLEGIVPRANLAATLKAELRRFFTTEFDPMHWDLQCDPDKLDDDYVQVKDMVLNHPWLAATK